ncbi:MAG: hypothetical protein OHK0052_05950 [Anaerolineales bacterium]
MQLIDKSPLVNADGSLSFFNRLQGSLKFGSSWPKDMQAQSDLIAQLQQSLGQNYVVLRNLTLGDTGVPIPIILIGPPGVFVIYVSSLRGVYRAKEDAWMVMEGNHFKPAQPNLVARTRLMGRAVKNFLDKEGIAPPEVESILLFTNPNQHVDAIHPNVRIVLSDAIDRFILSVQQGLSLLDARRIQSIVDALGADLSQATETAPEVSAKADEFDFGRNDKDDEPFDFGERAFGDEDESSTSSTLTEEQIAEHVESPAKPARAARKSPAFDPNKMLAGVSTRVLTAIAIFIFLNICLVIAAILMYFYYFG